MSEDTIDSSAAKRAASAPETALATVSPRLRRGLRLGILCAATCFILLLGWLNVRVYAVPDGATTRGEISADAVAQLNNISRRLKDNEGAKMQELFPEGWFFSHVIYGFAWVNIGLVTSNPELSERAISEVRWVLNRLDTPEALEPFLESTQVANGVFYLGWKNRLLGGLLAIQPTRDTTEAALFQRQSKELAEAFRLTPSRQLDSYPGHAWPCDNVMALASLRLHDELFESQYEDVIESWFAYTRRHLDPETGLIVHKIDGESGKILIPARASTQVYMHSLLPELYPEFAKDQYALFRKLFVKDWLGYLPVREYPKGKSGSGDVDTGPLILGICPSATVVSIAAARANGDYELAERSIILSETIGFPWRSGEEKSFGFGQIVVADAFLVWGKTLIPWTSSLETTFPNTTPHWWRLRLHGITLVLVVITAFGCRRLIRLSTS